jgi:hypothetical protein
VEAKNLIDFTVESVTLTLLLGSTFIPHIDRVEGRGCFNWNIDRWKRRV